MALMKSTGREAGRFVSFTGHSAYHGRPIILLLPTVGAVGASQVPGIRHR